MADENRVLNIVGLATPIGISPFLALISTVTLGAVITKEHGTGSLLVPTGILIFMLLGKLRGHLLLSVVITFFGFAAVFLRGAILQAELSGTKSPISNLVVGAIIVFYTSFVVTHICYIALDKRSKEAPQGAARVVRVPWDEGA